MTLQTVAPELNSNQKKLLLRELLSVLPEVGTTYAHKEYFSGYETCLTEVEQALTNYIEGNV